MSFIENISNSLKYVSIFILLVMILMIILSSIVYFSQDKSDETSKKNTKRASLGLFITSIILTVFSLIFYFTTRSLLSDISETVDENIEMIKDRLLTSLEKYP
jgi:NADH:ubiquinone oxidoreductase subunit 6 (subunit J)